MVEDIGLLETHKIFSGYKYVTEHKIPESKLRSIVFSFLKIISKSILLLFKKGIVKANNPRILIYVPNRKYERFLIWILPYIKKEYMIVSEQELGLDHYNVNKKIPLKSKFAFKYFYLLFKLFIISKKQGDIEKLRLLFPDLKKIVYLEIWFENLFKIYKFDKYFSLHPNSELNSIVCTLFSDHFKEIYGIRPESTTFSKEHKHIQSKNLFYKSDFEYKVYKSYNLDKNCTLIRCGLILPDTTQNDLVEKKQWKFPIEILFIDTCLNVYNESINNRVRAIKDFYEVFGNNESIVIKHKFHPGLDVSEKLKTVNLLKLFNNVSVISEISSYVEFNFCIGFYSTVIYELLNVGCPTLLLKGDYNTSETNRKYDLDYVGINSIYSITDIYSLKQDLMKGTAEKKYKLLNFQQYFRVKETKELIGNYINQ